MVSCHSRFRGNDRWAKIVPMSLRIIIPARYCSTRFLGKPLAVVAGVPLLQRVWALGASVVGREKVVVTTDDQRIADFCTKLGTPCIMTDAAIPNGTERAHAALLKLPADVDQVINLQGDAVLTPPWVIKAIIDEMQRGDNTVGVFTPAVKMSAASLAALREAKSQGEVGGTTVTFDRQHNALYFSKSIIPFVRDEAAVAVYRHIGLYGYRRDMLDQLVRLPSGPLEQAEKLEQLRALENGLRIRVIEVDYRGRSHTGVDSREDLDRAEKLIAKEGELLQKYDGSERHQS